MNFILSKVTEVGVIFLITSILLSTDVNDNITMNRKWKIKMYKNDH